MAIRIDGKAVSAQVRARVAGEVAALREQGVVPGLAVIIVGDDPASRVYVNNKKKACAEVGIRSEEFALPADTTQLQLMALVHQLNERKDISGILCQLPLPKHLDEEAACQALDPEKDVTIEYKSEHAEVVAALAEDQTAVGLLPIAVSGADIDKLMEGAASGRKAALENAFEDNDAMKYAAIRNILLRKGKLIEVTANYEPSLHYFGEWWKQLYGESEGKDQKGIFPAAVDLTTDLHSMGQFIQDGSRTMFETVINIEKSRASVVIDEDPEDLDGLNYLAGKDMDFVNKSAMNGTILAHTDGNVPNLIVNIPEQNEYYLGQLFYFFEFACGISGYLLGVNPFNQPGVESYKKNMFALLGKPGFEKEREELLKRL